MQQLGLKRESVGPSRYSDTTYVGRRAIPEWKLPYDVGRLPRLLCKLAGSIDRDPL